MAGKKKLFTRALGTEVVETSLDSLAAWVNSRKGRSGDLCTFQLETSLADQDAIDHPCCGGAFYGERWRTGIAGITGEALVSEPQAIGDEVGEDAMAITAIRRNAWAAVPSCSSIGITDRYYHDREEFIAALARAYGELARAMRDNGIAGHIYLGTEFPAGELEELAGPRTIFFEKRAHKKTLTRVLEYQTRLVIETQALPILGWLLEMYQIDELILLDPSPDAITQAAEVIDPARIVAGGYCRDSCSEYWNALAQHAVIQEIQPP